MPKKTVTNKTGIINNKYILNLSREKGFEIDDYNHYHSIINKNIDYNRLVILYPEIADMITDIITKSVTKGSHYNNKWYNRTSMAFLYSLITYEDINNITTRMAKYNVHNMLLYIRKCLFNAALTILMMLILAVLFKISLLKLMS